MARPAVTGPGTWRETRSSTPVEPKAFWQRTHTRSRVSGISMYRAAPADLDGADQCPAQTAQAKENEQEVAAQQDGRRGGGERDGSGSRNRCGQRAAAGRPSGAAEFEAPRSANDGGELRSSASVERCARWPVVAAPRRPGPPPRRHAGDWRDRGACSGRQAPPRRRPAESATAN